MRMLFALNISHFIRSTFADSHFINTHMIQKSPIRHTKYRFWFIYKNAHANVLSNFNYCGHLKHPTQLNFCRSMPSHICWWRFFLAWSQYECEVLGCWMAMKSMYILCNCCHKRQVTYLFAYISTQFHIYGQPCLKRHWCLEILASCTVAKCCDICASC